VALAEDRDRRADSPDEGNRCYAERAPRQRDMVYQADHCYSTRFSSCSVFLGWAARNTAEPAYVSEAAQKAWGSGISAPEAAVDPVSSSSADAETPPEPTLDGGLFGPAGPSETGKAASGADQLEWVSASAWAEAPWDERAEVEADELEWLAEEPEAEPEDDLEVTRDEEDTQAPKVPMRPGLIEVLRWKISYPLVLSMAVCTLPPKAGKILTLTYSFSR